MLPPHIAKNAPTHATGGTSTTVSRQARAGHEACTSRARSNNTRSAAGTLAHSMICRTSTVPAPSSPATRDMRTSLRATSATPMVAAASASAAASVVIHTVAPSRYGESATGAASTAATRALHHAAAMRQVTSHASKPATLATSRCTRSPPPSLATTASTR
ncbi:MAG: hypothetical protein EBR71_02080 [Planctomycetes bacterium]|nr:hypothetical protein [Planctomycetota bacterium]